jgi:hypothetical protein
MTPEYMDEHFDFKRIKTNYTYNGAKLKITDIKRKDGEKMTRKDMVKMCNTFQEELKQKYPDVDGLISVSIKYPQRWYSGDVSSFGEPVNYFTPSDSDLDFDDPEEYEMIRFQFIPFKKIKEGGKDEHNDCLMNCIMKYFMNTRKWIDPADLKKQLGLNRDDPIPITYMKQVEGIINRDDPSPYAIFVSGEGRYDSTIKSQKQIHLILTKGHYSINKETIITRKRQSFDEKPIMIVEYLNNEYRTFDGENTNVISRQEYDDMRFKKYLSCPFLIVDKDFTAESRKLPTIADSYHYYIELADELKKESNGLFNMYKCPTIKNMALNYFYDLTKVIQPEAINNNEAFWINKASSHAITYWEKYEGHVDIYDVNSHYPYVLQITNNMFPIKSGEFKVINAIQEKPEFGIYRCKITGKGKLFVFNAENYYTQADILVARDYGFTIELIHDGQPNFLYYSKDCLISGSTLFKKYVETLYSLKQNKVKGAKLLLNILWGALTENKVYKDSGNIKDIVDLSGRDIKRLQYDSHVRIHYINRKDGYFRTNYGRIKPFVLAYGRMKLYFRFKKYEDLIVRSHTDSLYLSSKPKDLPELSNKLGCLKHEYSGKVTINGLNKVIKKTQK